MKHHLLILSIASLLILSLKSALGQNYEYRPPIPPTPEAAALAKFAQVPVSYSTGTPNISIPLYEIKLREVSLPISLNYHAGGIRVDEIASSAGLGWTLAAGGNISSTVFDKPDMGPGGYATGNPSGDFPKDRELSPYSGMIPIPPDEDSLRAADYELLTRLIGMTSYTTINPNSAFDLQPDLFYYNLGGRSGKFFHTPSGEAFTVPFEPLKIVHDQNLRYTITDEQGVKYTFADRETSITYYQQYGPQFGPQVEGAYTPYSFVYHLSFISTPSGDTIRFEYDQYSYSFSNQVSYTRYLKKPGQFCNTNYNTRTESRTEVIGALRLKSIRSNRGHEVFFHYSSCDRADLPGSAALKSVEVKADGSTNRKVFRLTHSYFYSERPAVPSLDDCDSTGTSPEMLRLKLLTVEEEGKAPYLIDYDESVQLPSRMSQAQDHWGFFNGTTSLLPKDILRGFQEGGDREASADLMGAWTLSKLTYPTGGYTTFDFEAHDSYHARAVANEMLKDTAFYNSDYEPSSNVIIRELPFEIGPTVAAFGVTAKYEVSDATLYTPDYVRAEIRGITDPSFHRVFTNKSVPEGERLALLPGEYKLVIETQGSYDEAHVLLYWYEIQMESVTADQIAGGLRVKKITDYAEGSEPMVREFLYRSIEDSTQSSGRILYQPEYTYPSAVWTGLLEDLTQTNHEEFCEYTVQSTRSNTPLSSLSGSSVAYTAVSVLSGTGTGRNLSTYRYSFEEDYVPHKGPPFTPPTSKEWARGLLLEETDYLYSTKSLASLPLRRKKYTYTRDYTLPVSTSESGNYYLPDGINEMHALGLQVVLVRPAYEHKKGGCHSCFESAVFLIESFKHLSVWQYLSSTEERLFNSGDTTSYVTATTRFHYDNPGHAQTTRIMKSDSKGFSTGSRMVYPGDIITNASPAQSGGPALGLRALLDTHVIGKPIENQEWVYRGADSLLVGGTLSIYEPFGGYAALRQVLNFESSQPVAGEDYLRPGLSGQGAFAYDSRYREEYAFDQYSDQFNLLEFSNKGLTNALLWDEAKMLLLAQVKGASANQVAYINFELAAGTTGWSQTGSLVESHDAATGRWAFSGSVATPSHTVLPAGEYIVSFKAKGGGSVVVNGNATQVLAGWGQQVITLQNPGQVTVETSGGAMIDDLRLHPKGAMMTTFSYDPLFGVTSETDPNGRTTYYDYDASGRLKSVKDHEGNVIRSYEYHYAGQ